jgi:adenine deaminase
MKTIPAKKNTINKQWHEAHRMPANATTEQRIAWHVEHAKACGCRPIPPKLAQIIKDRAQSLAAPEPINNFHALPKTPADFRIKATSPKPVIRVIEAWEGQLITRELQLRAKTKNGYLMSDTSRDILKLVVVDRYSPSGNIAIAFIKNFGLKSGALASTVAHDSHNIIAVGVDDDSICTAVNKLIEHKGGIAVARTPQQVDSLPLPVAGLMSTQSGVKVAKAYTKLNKLAKELGTTQHAPFMTLSFMALLVIPALKLSDKGLFDGNTFQFTSLEV